MATMMQMLYRVVQYFLGAPREPSQCSQLDREQHAQVEADVLALKRCYYCKTLLPPWDRKGNLRCWDKETDTEYMAAICCDCGASAFYRD